MYFKCNSCPKAFDSKTSIFEHREKQHSGESGPEFSLLYKVPFLKPPKNIFSTRESYEEQLEATCRKWSRDFGFQCLSCDAIFQSVSDLASHNSQFCQIQVNSNKKPQSRLFPSAVEDLGLAKLKAFEESIGKLKEICGGDCDHCNELMIALQSHFETHGCEMVDIEETEKREPLTQSNSGSSKRRTRSQLTIGGSKQSTKPERTATIKSERNPETEVQKYSSKTELPKENEALFATESTKRNKSTSLDNTRKISGKQKIASNLNSSNASAPNVESLGLGVPSKVRVFSCYLTI